MTDDVEVGRGVYRPYLALLIGGMGTASKNFYRDLVSSYGYADEAGEISHLYRAGRKREAEAVVPDALIDGLALIGDTDHIRSRMAAFAAAGIDTLSIAPAGRSIDEKLAVVRTVGELARVALPSGGAATTDG